MAPITDDAVNSLKDLITKLENRVHELEGKLSGGGSDESANLPQAMRMTIMGPPGAGKNNRCGVVGRH